VKSSPVLGRLISTCFPNCHSHAKHDCLVGPVLPETMATCFDISIRYPASYIPEEFQQKKTNQFHLFSKSISGPQKELTNGRRAGIVDGLCTPHSKEPSLSIPITRIIALLATNLPPVAYHHLMNREILPPHSFHPPVRREKSEPTSY